MAEESRSSSSSTTRHRISSSCSWKSTTGEIGAKSGCEWCPRGELGYSSGSVGDGKLGTIKAEATGIRLTGIAGAEVTTNGSVEVGSRIPL